MLLIGNKSDLADKRAVKQEEAAEFAEQNKIGFVETSAKDNLNVDTAFSRLTGEIYTVLDGLAQKEEKEKSDTSSPNKKETGGGQTITLNDESAKKKKKGCC